MSMARGGGFHNNLAVEPEVEAAFVEAAPSEEDVKARKAEAAAMRSNAEQFYAQQIREQILVNIEKNGVDPALVQLDDRAMTFRVSNLRTLAEKGYKIDAIQREVLYSGKSRLFVMDGEKEDFLAMERADGQLMELEDTTRDMFASIEG